MKTCTHDFIDINMSYIVRSGPPPPKMKNFIQLIYLLLVLFLDDIVTYTGTVGTYIIMELNSPMLLRGVI